MVLVFILLFLVLIGRLFDLQIVNGESYLNEFSNSIEKEMSLAPTRGRIFDRNGKLLAYNELAYCVKIADSGRYENNDAKNLELNSIIEKALNIIEKYGDTYTNTMGITINENGNYEYTIEDNELLRFLRDSYGASSIDALTTEQKNATAKQVVNYYIDRYGIDENYTKEHILEIINLRRMMSANSYNRYITFTIAYEVSKETVAAILESSYELTGVTIEEEYIRKYNDSLYYAHLIGYTGNVSSSELAELQAKNPSYEANDIVGKTGIEQAFEDVLQGTKGVKTVYVDTVGRITEVLSETKPSTGNDVYLSIDFDMQKTIYEMLESEISRIVASKITNNSTKYVYNSSGVMTDIFIPATEAYFALLDNNIISILEKDLQASNTGQAVYNKYTVKQKQVFDSVKNCIANDTTPNGKLSTEMQLFINYVHDELLENGGIINKSKINKEDSTYKAWKADTISLKEYLTYAIAQGWVNMDEFTNNQYSSLNEAYGYLVDFIMDELKSDKGFTKNIYKALINSYNISGREICSLLYEQKIIPMNEADYYSLSRGGVDPCEWLRSKILSLEITPAQLALDPCSGSVIVTNPNTGEILAMVTYPSYDANMMSGRVDPVYYNMLRNDKSKPLLNRATTMQLAPGSTYKPCAAITGLEEGIIDGYTTTVCKGYWEQVMPNPKCWVYPGSHNVMNVSTAIQNSCNVFFFEVGYKLAMEKGEYVSQKGTNTFKSYAEDLGLATKAGIEIYEAQPYPSTTSAFASAIGQGNHNYSPLNLARYLTTIATSGTVYDFSLVNKITDPNGNIEKDDFIKVDHKANVKQSSWDMVHEGMRLAAKDQYFLGQMPFEVAGKSGTSQESIKRPDHALYISYAPYEKPEITVTVVIPNGYTSTNAGELTKTIYDNYFKY